MSMRERIRVGRSPIHGKGVFARRRLRKGGYIGTFEGRPTRTDGMYVLWVLDEDDQEMGVEGRNALRFLNHSAAPNAEFLGLDLHATRNIQPGQELTIDYGDAWAADD